MAASLDIVIKATNQASGVLNGLKRDMQSFSQQAQSVGTALSLGVTAPFALFAKTGVQTVADFSRTMAELEVVTGASGDALQTLNDTAIELGAVTSFSANEAAQAMLELSKAGMDTEDVLASIPGVLSLAAAGGVDLAYAANLTASSLNAFQLGADQAGYVSNLLAAAANESSANISDLAYGLQQGGFAFNAAGQDIDDLAASLAILTNVGLTGSDAGTALKNAFTRMMAPTKEAKKTMDALGISTYDAQGNMLPLSDIIGVLNGALDGMTQQQRNAALETIFLSDGMKAMIPLLDQGEDGFLLMKDAVNQAGAAQEVADAKMRGLAGAFEYAQGSIESALLTVFKPLEMRLANLIKFGADLITRISQLPRPILDAAMAFGAVLAAAGPLLLMIPAITAFLGAMLSPIGLVVVALAGLAAAFAGDWGGIRGIASEVLAALNTVWEGLKTGNLQPLIDMLNGIKQTILDNVPGWVTAFTSWASNTWATLSPYLVTFATMLGNWILLQGVAIGVKVGDWAKSFASWASDIWTDLSTNLGTMWTSLTTWVSNQVDVLYPYVSKWTAEFATWAGEIWTDLSTKLGEMWTSLTTWVSEQAALLPANLLVWKTAFVEWVTNAWADVQPKLAEYSTSLKTWAEEQGPILERETKKWGKSLSNWVPKDTRPMMTTLGENISTGILGLQETVGTAIGYMIGAALGGAIRFLTDAVSIFVIGIIGQINKSFEGEGSKEGSGDAVGTLVGGMFKNAGRMLGAIVKGFVDQIDQALNGPVAQLMDKEWAKLTANIAKLWEDMVIAIGEATMNMRTSLRMGFLQMSSDITSKVSAIKTAVLIDFALMKMRMEGIIEEAKTAVIGKFNEFATGAATAIATLKTTVQEKFNEIKSWIEGLTFTNPFSQVMSWASGAVTAVQNAVGAIGGAGGSRGATGGDGRSPYAAGTPFFRGGFATINERGTELIALPGRNRNVWLPRGTSIYPAEQVAGMSGGGVTVNLYANVSNGMDVEAMAYQVASVLRRNQR